ncbi:MAG: cyclic nucleotide-binding domain-containing protein [Rubrobacteraceae bacterium]
MFSGVFERFVSFRRIPIKVVIVTALASWALQAWAFMTDQPIYTIAILAVIPWIPLALFEGLWKFQHYSWIAVFAVVAALQVLHLGEHALQVIQLGALNGTLACPPPSTSFGQYATTIVMPDANGQPTNTVGPAACGVLGFLDFELVHLVWDSLVWLGALWLLTRFPRNKWLWVAMIFASIHEVEHLFLGYIFYLENPLVFAYQQQLWDISGSGNNLTATPAGFEETQANFYTAGGKTGLLGKSGLVESLIFGAESARFLARPYLHMGYNTLVVIPTVIAFLVQAREVRNKYLVGIFKEKDMDSNSLGIASSKLERETFAPGEVIVKQGDPADKFYIITRGQVEVLRDQPNEEEILVSRLGEGQYFGEIGLMHGGKRTATVRAAGGVETMTLDRNTFGGLVDDSERSRAEFDRIARQRIGQLQASQNDRN